MAAVSDFLDEVVLGASSADGPVQAWDVRTGMQLKAYKCVPSPVPTGTFFAPRVTFFGSARRTHHADAPLVRWTDPDPSVFLARVPNASPGPPRADAGDCAALARTTSVRLARAPRSAAAAAAHRASLGRDVPRADLHSRRARFTRARRVFTRD